MVPNTIVHVYRFSSGKQFSVIFGIADVPQEGREV